MTTGVTRQWVAQQAAKARAPVTEGWQDGGALIIFVAGTPAHGKNKVGHWSQRARWL